MELKNALINEIFIAYRETGIVYRKSASEEVKGQVDFIRFGLERMLKNLLPLDERQEKNLEELRASFRPA